MAPPRRHAPTRRSSRRAPRRTPRQGRHDRLARRARLGRHCQAAGRGAARATDRGARIGIEQPGCVAWEPAFGQDFEWAFLAALGRLGRPDGSSAYFGLSSQPIDQSLAAVPDDAGSRPGPGLLKALGRPGPSGQPPLLPASLGRVNRHHTPVRAVVVYVVIAAAIVLAASGQEQELVLVYAVAVPDRLPRHRDRGGRAPDRGRGARKRGDQAPDDRPRRQRDRRRHVHGPGRRDRPL